MHRSEVPLLFLLFAFVVMVSAFMGYMNGREFGRLQVRQEAIDAGVAHWTIDPKTGERSFAFIKPVPPTKTGR